jgi:hypothetical protein
MIRTPSNNPHYTKRTSYGGLFNLQAIPSYEKNYPSYMSFNLSKLDFFGQFFKVFFKLKKMMNQGHIWLKQIQFNATLYFQ